MEVKRKTKLLRAVVYARVSTMKIEQEQSLDIQMESIEQYCNEQGFQHIETFKEHGKTATSLRKRPEFLRMMYDAGLDFIHNNKGIDHFQLSDREPLFDVIFVKDTTRFSRNAEQAINAVNQLLKKNVNVVFLNSGISTFDKSSNMILQILFTVAESESQATGDKVKYSKRSLAKKNIYRPSRLPYGYKKEYNEDDGYEIVVNESQRKVVETIFHMYIHENKGVVGIAKFLNEHNIPANGRNGESDEAVWQELKIKTIISDTTYYGSPTMLRMTKRKVTDNYAAKVDESEHVQIHDAVEPIITKEVFEMAQKIKKERTNEWLKIGRRTPTPSPYKGKIKCIHCNSLFCKTDTEKEGVNSSQYSCRAKKRYGKNVCEKGSSISDFQLKKYIMASDIQIDDLQRNLTYVRIKEAIGNAYNKHGQLIEEARLKIEELKEEIKATLSALKREEDEFIRAQYRAEIEEYRQKAADAEIELEELKGNLIERLSNKVEKKRKFLEELRNRKSELFTLEERIELIKTIQVDKEQIIITYNTPNFNEEINEFNRIFEGSYLRIEPHISIDNVFKYKRSKSPVVITMEEYYQKQINRYYN